MRARPMTLLVALATLGLLIGVMPSAQADSGTETYIVRLKKTVSASSASASLGANAKILNRVHAAVAHLTPTQAAALKNNPNVVSVRKNAKVKASGQENNAPWDLDVIDNRAGTTDTVYNYPNTGAGVTVYVVDSGLIPTHNEFVGKSILPGVNFVPNVLVKYSDTNPSIIDHYCGPGNAEDLTVDPANTLDQVGHGTAVSSLISGAQKGISKDATIVPVRVLDCDGAGDSADVVSAADWIIGQHVPGTPAVVNMSFGAPITLEDVNIAVQDLLDNGITVVAAAGNEDIDACGASPAQVPGVITVAATTKARTEPTLWGTNYGNCVDLYAPGDAVEAANWENPGGYVAARGTSFSSPLVAGAAAQVLADHPTWTPEHVAADLSDRATYGVISGARSVNKLLNVNGLGTITGTAPTISSPTRVGDVVSAQLHWTPVPTTATYQWSLDGVPIPQATAATYVPTIDDLGKSLTVAVTGSYPGYVDISDTSAAVVIAAAPPPPPAGMVTPLQPSRLMDTRIGVGANGPLTNGRTVALHVAGVGGVTNTATAVLINITCTGATASGFITGHASGTGMPGVSNANFIAGKTGANLALIPVGSDGSIWLTSAVSNGGTVQLIIDLQGYVSGGGKVTEAGAVVPVDPQRLADTRYSGAVGGGGTLDIQTTAAAGVAANASAVFLNVTVTQTGTPGFLTAYPYGESRPGTSNLNFVAGQTVPNMVLVKVGPNGLVSIFNASATAVHIIVDIQGYVTAGTPTAKGAVVPISPARVLDTRYGIGSGAGAVGSGSERVITFTGDMGNASGVFMNLTVTEPRAAGFLAAYPTGSRPAISNLNFDAGATVPNLAAVALAGSRATVLNASNNNGTAQIVADVFAYIL